MSFAYVPSFQIPLVAWICCEDESYTEGKWQRPHAPRQSSQWSPSHRPNVVSTMISIRGLRRHWLQCKLDSRPDPSQKSWPWNGIWLITLMLHVDRFQSLGSRTLLISSNTWTGRLGLSELSGLHDLKGIGGFGTVNPNHLIEVWASRYYRQSVPVEKRGVKLSRAWKLDNENPIKTDCDAWAASIATQKWCSSQDVSIERLRLVSARPGEDTLASNPYIQTLSCSFFPTNPFPPRCGGLITHSTAMSKARLKIAAKVDLSSSSSRKTSISIAQFP